MAKIYQKHWAYEKFYWMQVCQVKQFYLDEKNARMLNELFKQINEDYKQTLLVVTHDERMAEFATKRVHMQGGILVPYQDFNAKEI